MAPLGWPTRTANEVPGVGLEDLNADSSPEDPVPMPLHRYIFRGRGTFPTVGFNDAERARP